jgi:mono/diheme cytochrome c family protein
MKLPSLSLTLLACAALLATVGCWNPPGRPRTIESEALRPDQVLSFPVLYAENCAGCHGAQGRDGAAISLANPVYVAFAGAGNIAKVTAAGVPGTLMPPFAKQSGGNLTDRQVEIIAQGIVSSWSKPAAGNPGVAAGQMPPYTSSSTGNPASGQKAFTTYCARCHGPDATGTSAGKRQKGSLIDPAYLALISDQGLRSIIVAGAPRQGMPDWRSDAPQAAPMSDGQIADIVAWLGSFRTQTPGQPYNAHQ